jgi:hypothetical protein
MPDDFPQAIKDVLAKRVGSRCSLPDCRATTSGPHSDPSKVLNVGVACHITAASAGGPRYELALTSEQRKAAENGIWLCQTHAKLIDNDTTRFTVEVLRGWKQLSEQMTKQELDAMSSSAARDLIATSGRLTAILLDATEHFDQLSASGATDSLASESVEVARQLEHRINDVVIDALALKANPLFDTADRQDTAIAVKTMRAALRLRGFQYRPGYVDYDEDIFRAYVPPSQNEYGVNSVERARTEFVDAFDQFERLTGLRTLRTRKT